LSDAVRSWLRLQANETFSDEVQEAMRSRMDSIWTPWHSLAYMMDNRRGAEDEGWPSLDDDRQNEARNAIDKMGDEVARAMIGYEMEDTSVYPERIFRTTVKKDMDPVKYWKYVAMLASKNAPAKAFANRVAQVFSLPPSSAGIERVFSTAGLVQSKLRNRLPVSKVGRLVTVSRLLPIVNQAENTSLELEEFFEEEDE